MTVTCFSAHFFICLPREWQYLHMFVNLDIFLVGLTSVYHYISCLSVACLVLVRIYKSNWRNWQLKTGETDMETGWIHSGEWQEQKRERNTLLLIAYSLERQLFCKGETVLVCWTQSGCSVLHGLVGPDHRFLHGRVEMAQCWLHHQTMNGKVQKGL